MGFALSQGEFDGLTNQAARFAREYQKAEFFQVIGDIKSQEKSYAEATKSYMRALTLTQDRKAQAHLKKQILKINQLDEPTEADL